MFDVDCPNTPDGNSPKLPTRPPSVARRIANARTASTGRHTNRIRAASYDDHRVGLEPEEVVRPSAPRGNINVTYRSNPFDDDSLHKQQQRGRTHSENWWREDIVDESADKEDVLDGYYGLSQKG